jgi:hypothetical protein
MFQPNEQQRHFNDLPESELHEEVDSIQAILKLLFTPSNNGMSSFRPFSSVYFPPQAENPVRLVSQT